MRRLTQPKTNYIVEYPEAIKFTETQMSIFWPPDEIKVEKDVHDILTNLTPSEKHGVLTTLKLFTKYEMIVGEEYWGRVGQMFKKPACIQRMANCNAFFELNIHAPFYANINDALGLANEEFYDSYIDDPLLKERIDMLEAYAEARSDEFLMMLALTEGAILYSSFAFLKHFQSQGKNKITNIVRGINFSARDEGLHSEASAWLYRTYMEEEGMSLESNQGLLVEMAEVVRDHEHAIVDKIFEQGEIDGITPTQMKHFVDSRINVVARNLGYNNLYDVKYNPIGDWFYDSINNYVSNDFFAGVGREYSRNWDEGEFEW